MAALGWEEQTKFLKLWRVVGQRGGRIKAMPHTYQLFILARVKLSDKGRGKLSHKENSVYMTLSYGFWENVIILDTQKGLFYDAMCL